jgi:glycosyltransferase involved in cell wall biosynthesis
MFTKQLKEIIDRNRIDIVNCQLEKTMPVGVMAAKCSRRKPLVFTIIHGLVGGMDNRLSRKLTNFFYYRHLDGIICVSDSIKDDVIRANYRFDHRKVNSVQNGLVYDRFMITLSRAEARSQVLPNGGKRFWFGTVGRLVEKKNHKNLLLALSEVVKIRRDCALLIAGNGPLERPLQEMVSSLNLQDYVFFLGKRSDVPEILKALDVFLFPTYREGLPLALLEAMASGLPVIASDIPVVKEVFGATDMGSLVDPDAPTEIAQAMLGMMDLADERLRQMGENAKQRALRDFSAARMVQGYEAVFEGASLKRQGQERA